jgi:3-dehydroquinate synthase
MGMLMAAELSRMQGLITESEVEQVRDLLVHAGLPVQMELDPEVIFGNIRKDKKKSGELIHFVLLEGLGQTLIKPMELSKLKPMIHDLC